MPGDADWALFLDFDGTLVEIADRPEAVVVEPGLTDTLATLRDGLGGALALVSGRPIASLDGFLTPYRFDAAGLHGVEHRIRGELFPCRPEAHPTLRDAVEELPGRLPQHPGILIEDKGCSVGVHWRLAPEHDTEVLEIVEELATALGPNYRLQAGKAVAEILPARAAKGPAIAHFLTEEPFRGRRAIFCGDDLTDEHGFLTVNELGGVTVRVGPGPTGARRRVETPAALRSCLAAWARQGRVDVDMLGQA
ncbi:MAG TPA: trehalose-phosphatase [Beijerinckiaceae bacterium]|jgi:trehalose 6-phosphate phosphatase